MEESPERFVQYLLRVGSYFHGEEGGLRRLLRPRNLALYLLFIIESSRAMPSRIRFASGFPVPISSVKTCRIPANRSLGITSGHYCPEQRSVGVVVEEFPVRTSKPVKRGDPSQRAPHRNRVQEPSSLTTYEHVGMAKEITERCFHDFEFKAKLSSLPTVTLSP